MNDLSGDNDNEVFMSEFEWMSNGIMSTTEDSFSASLRDCDFPGVIDKNTRTRDELKQLWESTCSLTVGVALVKSQKIFFPQKPQKWPYRFLMTLIKMKLNKFQFFLPQSL